MDDFSNFFRKIMEKHNWDKELGRRMIQAYDKERHLEKWELQYMSTRVSYPEKFWKVANHYFNSKKSWANNRDLEKLEKVCIQEGERSDFLRILFDFAP